MGIWLCLCSTSDEDIIGTRTAAVRPRTERRSPREPRPGHIWPEDLMAHPGNIIPEGQHG